MSALTFAGLVNGAPIGRFDGITRPYSPEDVLRLSGSFQVRHSLAERGANRLWQLLHSEPYLPSLGAMIDQVPQARARIADAQKRIVTTIRDRDPAQAEEWMAKHIRDFRRGFEIAGIDLDGRIGGT